MLSPAIELGKALPLMQNRVRINGDAFRVLGSRNEPSEAVQMCYLPRIRIGILYSTPVFCLAAALKQHACCHDCN